MTHVEKKGDTTRSELRFLQNDSSHYLLLLSQLFLPLLGRTKSRGRYCAAIWLSHRPEQSGRAVHGRSMDWTTKDNMVDGLHFCATLTGCRGGRPWPDDSSFALFNCASCSSGDQYFKVANALTNSHAKVKTGSSPALLPTYA